MSIDATLVRAQPFVAQRDGDNGKEAEGEYELGRDVPLFEDDAGVFDLGVPMVSSRECELWDESWVAVVPEHVHRAFGTHVHAAMSAVVAVIHTAVVHCSRCSKESALVGGRERARRPKLRGRHRRQL